MADNKRGQPNREWKWLLISVCLILGLAVIICSVLVEKLKRGMDEMIADHPVTYTMPAAAQIIDEYTSLADWFGDFDYCSTFRISDAEYNRLLQNGFNWIYIGQGSTTPTPHAPVWLSGRLPNKNSSLWSGCFARLSASPTDAQEYRYLLDDEPSFLRLLAIDEESKVIYYYRGSW